MSATEYLAANATAIIVGDQRDTVSFDTMAKAKEWSRLMVQAGRSATWLGDQQATLTTILTNEEIGIAVRGDYGA